MLPSSYAQRIDQCKSYIPPVDHTLEDQVNCVGSALFLMGIIDRDTFIDPREAYGFLKRYFLPSEGYEEGITLALANKGVKARKFHVAHVGIITHVDKGNILVTSRLGTNDRLEEDAPIKSTPFGNAIYWDMNNGASYEHIHLYRLKDNI